MKPTHSCMVMFLALSMFSSFAFCQPTNTPERQLSFDESIKFALLNNRDLLMAKEDLDITRQKANEALSFRYPQVDLMLNYSRYQSENPYYIPPNFGNFLLTRGEDQLYGTRVGLQQLLYAGRKYKNTQKSSDISIRRVRSDYERIRNDVVYNTKKDFYTYQMKSMCNHFLADHIQTLTTYDAKNDQQDIKTYIDGLNMQLQDGLLEEQLSRLEFLDSIGVDLNTTVQTVGDIVEEQEIGYDEAMCIARALQKRPELLKSQAQEELGLLEMNISMAERTPRVVLGAGYQYTSSLFNTDSKYWSKDWDVSLSVSIPIFDGGAWLARDKQKRSNLRKATIKHAAVEEQITKEVEIARLQYTYQKKRIDAVQQAIGDLAGRKARLESMSKDSAWLREEKTFITDTLKMWQVIFDYNMSVLYMRFVMGEP